MQTLRRAGFDNDRLDAIEQLVGEAGAAAQISPPLPKPSLAATMIAEILIGAAEIRPGDLRRYGDVEESTAQRLEILSARLTELADVLDVSAPPAPRDPRTQGGA